MSEERRLRKDFDTVMSFPEGVRVLRFFLFQTGYNELLTLQDRVTGELCVNSTLANLAKRDIWTQVRMYITPEQQCKLEQPEEPVKTEKEKSEIPEELLNE